MKKKEKNEAKSFIKEGILNPFSTQDEKLWVEIREGKRVRAFSLNDDRFQMLLKDIIQRYTGEIPPVGEFLNLVAELELLAYKRTIARNLTSRIALSKKNWLCYDLDASQGLAYKISADGYEDIQTPSMVFRQSATYAPQVKPDEDTEAEELPELVKKHFRLQTEEDNFLFSIYLVTAFLKPLVNVPLLILQGEKGSSKSSVLRRIEQIVDPKTTDIMGAPRNNSDLEIRLNNNYFTTLDNLSFLSKKTSDLLARAITGGSTYRRKLYTDTNEIVLNLGSVIALNGIGLVATEADLLDRAIVFKLRRIPESEIKTERELKESFEGDLPKFIGAIFLCISEVLADAQPIAVQKKTRMADWFEYAVKVGRIFGLEDEKTAEVIWKNQKTVNRQTLGENLVAQCLMELMSSRDEYLGSVTQLLGDLCDIAEKNAIKSSLLPGQPNVLSRRLNELKSNLETAGIFFEIKNIGAFRQIHIWKKLKRRKSKN